MNMSSSMVYAWKKCICPCLASLSQVMPMVQWPQITQNATSLPDDEETPTDIEDYTSSTWASLTKDTLDNLESCVL